MFFYLRTFSLEYDVITTITNISFEKIDDIATFISPANLCSCLLMFRVDSCYTYLAESNMKEIAMRFLSLICMIL